MLKDIPSRRVFSNPGGKKKTIKKSMKRKNVKCADCVITAGLNVRHTFIIYGLWFYLPTAGMKINAELNEALSRWNYRTAKNK